MAIPSEVLRDVGWTGDGLYGGAGTAAGLPALYQDGHMDWDNGGFVAMFIIMAVFWGGVLAIAAWAVAVYARRGGDGRDSALEIAKTRYARGEITAEEFERIKGNLR